jgi:hypothetical protein
MIIVSNSQYRKYGGGRSFDPKKHGGGKSLDRYRKHCGGRFPDTKPMAMQDLPRPKIWRRKILKNMAMDDLSTPKTLRRKIYGFTSRFAP